jgi:hypothetical protein
VRDREALLTSRKRLRRRFRIVGELLEDHPAGRFAPEVFQDESLCQIDAEVDVRVARTRAQTAHSTEPLQARHDHPEANPRACLHSFLLDTQGVRQSRELG